MFHSYVCCGFGFVFLCVGCLVGVAEYVCCGHAAWGPPGAKADEREQAAVDEGDQVVLLAHDAVERRDHAREEPPLRPLRLRRRRALALRPELAAAQAAWLAAVASGGLRLGSYFERVYGGALPAADVEHVLAMLSSERYDVRQLALRMLPTLESAARAELARWFGAAEVDTWVQLVGCSQTDLCQVRVCSPRAARSPPRAIARCVRTARDAAGLVGGGRAGRAKESRPARRRRRHGL